MLTNIHPKLPMRNKLITKDFYINKLGFKQIEGADYEGYLMLCKDAVEIHFFEHKTLDILTNYGQVYIRTSAIEVYYDLLIKNGVSIHPNGSLEIKPWKQKEFSILDPDYNLLTFGEAI
ncbi:hypothetical protein Q361_10151 [Flavobacterium croceum DSM 17960]|uniref:Bleomycin resistance protein n=1 Tax=Flavobacterium croceum DSM 17960 TaxID=1121886 RepID=A0A2S4NBX3_9FLAO|nr:VOC family protein [Flavobacterium croceum]POS02953.1 hypothetical protein Q361_10151 [Flavobacterium croceum DSM 17960]